MGGMGFIENNKTDCMLSVLINTNLLRACLVNKIKKYYFSSSACVYNADKQTTTFIEGLKEAEKEKEKEKPYISSRISRYNKYSKSR